MAIASDNTMRAMSRHSELIRIERSNLEITRLALGTAALGGLYTSVTDEDAEKVRTLYRSFGFNTIDFQGGHDIHIETFKGILSILDR